MVVACIGETMALLTPVPPGRLEDAATLSLHAAGAESNVACYLADHRVAACWVSRVGDDPFGRMVRREIAAGGVDVTAVEIDPARPTGVYFKHRAAAGTEVLYYRRGSAASAMSPAVLDHPVVRAAGALHLSGITPALSSSCRELVEAALRAGPGRAPLISFDVNWRPALWDEADDPGGVLAGLARQADVVFVGLDEAAQLWECANPAEVRAVLPEPRLLVVKDGDRAASAFDQTGVAPLTVPALGVDVVDAVGAGDAFAAGVLAGLFRGLDLRGQLRLGHVTAVAALRVAADHGPLLPPATLDRLLRCDQDTWESTRIAAGRKLTAGAAPAPIAAEPG